MPTFKPVESLLPPVGTKVEAFFIANTYQATVIRHGRKYPHIRFTLKNKRVIEGPATILEHGAPTGVIYRGYLARMYHPTFYAG